MNYFKDKIAIITGGGSGIGQALCEELANAGAVVIVADINGVNAQHVAEGIVHNGGQATTVQVDVTQLQQVQKLVTTTVAQWGRLDYMFNNAGIAITGQVRDLDISHWQKTLDVNLWGVIYGTTTAYQAMLPQQSGHIVNIASITGLIPYPVAIPYATTKHAVVGLSTSLRTEAAKLGIKVSVACPGYVKTKIFEHQAFVNVDQEKLLKELFTVKMVTPTICAQAILRGVQRNQAIIPVTALAWIVWWLYRLHPALITPLVQKLFNQLDELRLSL